jgi:hypothetical protein
MEVLVRDDVVVSHHPACWGMEGRENKGHEVALPTLF